MGVDFAEMPIPFRPRKDSGATTFKVDTVALHVTSACSHACQFCYAGEATPKSATNPSRIVKIINALSIEKVREIIFLGGDPCQNPGLLNFSRVAKERGIVTTVLSNTHNYRESDLSVLNLVDNIEATIHGPKAEDHDAVAMSDGAFLHIIKRLKELSDAGARIGIVYNIMPSNFSTLYDTIYNLILNIGINVRSLTIQRIIPQGRAKNTNKFFISAQHAAHALGEIERIEKDFRLRIIFEDTVPFCSVPARFHRFLRRCEWGYTRASLDGDGNLSRCGADPRYGLGNILQNSLGEIWNSSQILKDFRGKRYLPEECHQCSMFEKCGGGCSLACELNNDHGVDHLYSEVRTNRKAISSPRKFELSKARDDSLSDILRIEWAIFSDYRFRFTAKSLKKWFKLNPSMFFMLEDIHSKSIVGYCCTVPLTELGLRKITTGGASSLDELSASDVMAVTGSSHPYWHVEAIATLTDIRSRAGRTLIKALANHLVAQNAKCVTVCPITGIGERLCKFFNFELVGKESIDGHTYEIYRLDDASGIIQSKIGHF